MSDHQAPQPGAEPNPAQAEADKPTPTEPPKPDTDWKAEARKWEQRAKDNSTAADELAKLAESQMTELEKAQTAAQKARQEAEKATTDALRFRVAAKHGISDEDADLFLTGTDAETLERQAARLVERTPTSPKPDPTQGAKGSGSTGTAADSFADFFRSKL